MTTTNSDLAKSNQEAGSISLPSEAEIESIYDSIEQHARDEYHPQLLPKLSPRLIMILLAVAAGIGVLVGSADLKVDTTITFDTKLGQRTQPHWLVPKGAKVVKTDTGEGAVKGLGWLIGGLASAGLWHLAGNDQRWQTFVGTLQTQWVEDYFRRNKAIVELRSMAAVQTEKQRLDTVVNLDLAEQTWQFHQAIGYDPAIAQSVQNQNALPYGAPGTYDEINDPSDKVKEGETSQGLPPSAKSSQSKRLDLDDDLAPVKRLDLSKQSLIMPPLVDYPACLVFGAPGGGKTTFIDKVVKKKIEAGHEVVVLDPHYKLGAWEGCKVYGKAYNYEEIDAEMLSFCKEVKERYERLATEKNPVFKPLSIIADEFTMYGKKCKNAGAFLWLIVTDIRKVNCFATLGGHTNTLAGLGGKEAAGSAKLLIDALLEIEIDSKQHPVTGRSVPAFQAWVKLPGMRRKDAFGVRIQPDTDTSENSEGDRTSSVLIADLPDELLGDIWEEKDGKPEPKHPEPAPEQGSGRRFTIQSNDKLNHEPIVESLNRLQDGEFSDPEKRYTSLNLARNAALALVRDTLNEKNKTETIESLWRCKKGGSVAWKEAISQFDDLIG